MDQEIIKRSEQKIDYDDFHILFNLNKECEWLNNKDKALYDLWCLAENNKQKELIEILIKKFKYINDRDSDNGCVNITNQIEKEWKLNPDNTVISATCDTDNPDGSQMILQLIKNKLSENWKERMLYNSIKKVGNNILDNYNIVLIDDFIGTGNTINNKVNYLLKILTQRNIHNTHIYVVSLAAMNFAKESLDKLSIQYYSVYWLVKGISDNFEPEQKDEAIKSMEDLESKLEEIVSGKKLQNFGYKRSESLFALGSYNIPNNVFPIFWWPKLKGNIKRETLFKRI